MARSAAALPHRPGCSSCDTARQVLAELRVLFDPMDSWDEVEMPASRSAAAMAGRRVPVRGTGTVADIVLALVADVLHRNECRILDRSGT